MQKIFGDAKTNLDQEEPQIFVLFAFDILQPGFICCLPVKINHEAKLCLLELFLAVLVRTAHVK